VDHDVPGFSAQSFTESTNSTGVMTFGTAGSSNLPWTTSSPTRQPDWQHGRHISKFGAQISARRTTSSEQIRRLLGGFNYGGAFTGDRHRQSIGYDFADFLLDLLLQLSVSEQTETSACASIAWVSFARTTSS